VRRTGESEVIDITGGAGDEAAIARAARVMADGGLVAFPTDTVYGLGADPSRPDAEQIICAAKGRERSKPLARLVHDAAEAARIAGSWPRLAGELARACWPGALTIVVGEVGLRVPANRVARQIASRLGGAVMATSANRSGEPEPHTAEEVAAALGPAVELILDGGRTEGMPSTVVRVAGGEVEILREGAIRREDIYGIARTIRKAEGDAA
jgi:L-threonylcarbamoyladenylate synthase